MSTRVLFAHATGLCKETWQPVMSALQGSTAHHFDFKGHGSRSSEALNTNPSTWDTFAVADVFNALGALPGEGPIVGCGHSFGGAAMLKAEVAKPGTFSALVLCEPILLDHDIALADPAPLADRATKRRAEWESLDEARAYFLHKPMFQGWEPAALEGYLSGGLLGNSPCRLACTPQSEAACYRGVGRALTDAELNDVQCPVIIIVGRESHHLDARQKGATVSEESPTATVAYFQGLAAKLPRGAVALAPGGHFHPQERPGIISSAINAAVRAVQSSHSRL